MSFLSQLHRKLASVLPILLLLAFTAGCGQELAQENQELKQSVETKQTEIERLKRDLELKSNEISSLEDDLKTSSAALAAMRLGATSPKTKLYATIKTNMGDIKTELFWLDTPKTVQNFVQLAEGTKPWTDPKTGKRVSRPFYDGLIFHRVIPKFMIQGGDPKGNGSGGPGYTFDDEIVEGLEFDQEGLLAMANRGPNTNGSQFFLTTGKANGEAGPPNNFDRLKGGYTIFGKVISGYDLVVKIGESETVKGDRRKVNRPVEDVIIETIKIDRVN